MLNPAKNATAPSTTITNRYAGHVERYDQLHQRSQRCQAVAADGKGHCAESSDGRQTHQDIDDAEHSVRKSTDQVDDGLRTRAGHRQRKAEQDRKQQHLQNVAFGESVDHGIGNDVHHKVGHALRFGLSGVLRHGFRVERSGIDIESCARLYDISNHQTDQ